MEKVFKHCLLLLVMLFAGVSVSHAQLRDEQHKASDYSGPIIKQNDPSDGAKLGNLFNMKMSHSYSVNFSSFGGQVQNLNAYTNTTQFFFSPKLTGRVDLSLIHSPFSNNNINSATGEQEVQFILQNAELDYQISDKASLHLQVNQYPQGYGYYHGYGGYGGGFFQSSSPFGRY